MTISLTVRKYRFDISKPEDAKQYRELCETLKNRGFRNMQVSNWNGDFYRSLEDGKAYALESKHLFDNQYNADGLRLHEWTEGYFPNRNLKSGYYLDFDLAAMDELKANRHCCGYCGHQYDTLQGDKLPSNGFCEKCLDNEYLTENRLSSLRLLPLNVSKERQPLTETETAELLPIFIRRQTVDDDSRNKAKLDKIRADAIAKCEKRIANATNERDGFIWLLDNQIPTDNCIFYDHKGIFSFGWRSNGLDESTANALRERLENFPFKYEIKTHS